MVRILGNKRSAVRSQELNDSLENIQLKKIAVEVPKSGQSKCSQFQKNFKTRKIVKFHKKTSHQRKSKKVFEMKTPICFNNNNNEDNNDNENNSKIGQYKCSICEDKFESPIFLEEHTKNVHRVHVKSNRKVKISKIIKDAINAGIKMACARKLF